MGWAFAVILTGLLGLGLASWSGSMDAALGPAGVAGPVDEGQSETPAPVALVGAAGSDAGGESPPQPEVESRSTLDQDELTAMGELGFLPGLVQALAPASDCSFDDALSTCQ